MLRMAFFGPGGQIAPRLFFARFPFRTPKARVPNFFWDQFFGAKSAIGASTFPSFAEPS